MNLTNNNKVMRQIYEKRRLQIKYVVPIDRQ